ncbi:DNA_pol_A_exo1 domain-containing protein, partial [Cephalotus follicularis]
EMAYTHLVSFCGKIIETTVTQNASIADSWAQDVLSKCNACTNINIVGLNCKWKPHPISSMSNKIATMQLCIDTHCLILQSLYMDNVPPSIKSLLSDPRIVLVGVEVDEVVLKLKNEYGVCCNKTIDVRMLVKLHFPLSFRGKPGLKALANPLLPLHGWKPKNISACLNHMESRVLDVELITFACIDAYVSYRIGYKLLKEM